MKIDPKATLLALFAALAAGEALAQQAQEGIAKLTELHGNVLVSRATGLAAGAEATRLQEGVRVITTSKSGVVIEYDNGCRVELKENQRFQVERDKPCEALIAQVESMVQAPTAVAEGAGPGLLTPGTVAQAGLVGLAVWRWRQNESTVSPN